MGVNETLVSARPESALTAATVTVLRSSMRPVLRLGSFLDSVGKAFLTALPSTLGAATASALG